MFTGIIKQHRIVQAMLYIYKMKKNDAGVDEVGVDKLEFRHQKASSVGVSI